MAATTAKVKMGNKLSRSFHFNAGVKQGDGLSAVLFNIALQKAIEEGGSERHYIQQAASTVKSRVPRNIYVNDKRFAGVEKFKYLGCPINAKGDNAYIRERIQAANRAYYANVRLFKSKLVAGAQDNDI
ncbi:hypothetical protein LSTR_LSTR005369 [Laodelphax striatellus]|uniref:Reverse transcriptase domain-containing protein n=1 Tax=Laodelphax striatellus TaxID=195883 RepID=A0A482WRP9_LAOST|nr:hypothetical protein LSTR_LSTR005369 [Laodelphax striatellus]